MKQSLRASKDTLSLPQKLGRFLFAYRNAPHSTTKVSPAELFLGRSLRSRLDLLKPSLEKTVKDNQLSQIEYRERKAKFRDFNVGDKVRVRNYRGNDKWKTGIVVEKSGPVSYLVEIENGTVWRRHIEQIINFEETTKLREVLPTENQFSSHAHMPSFNVPIPNSEPPSLDIADTRVSPIKHPNDQHDKHLVSTTPPSVTSVTDSSISPRSKESVQEANPRNPTATLPVPRRYPVRTIKKPNRLDL